MKVLFGMLLAMAFVVAGADGLAAQQASGTSADTTHHAMRHHMTTHHVRHTARKTTTTHHARHHVMTTRMRHERRTSSVRMAATRTPPSVLGREIGPSGISSAGRMQRLANGLITPDAARTIALRNTPDGSSVSKIDLATSEGRRVYEVKVQTPNRAGNQKVTVDAMTGQILETKNVDNPIGGVTNTMKGAIHKVTPHH